MGRKKTGLKRPFYTQVTMTRDEDEYISRCSHKWGIDKSTFLRNSAIGGSWKEKLNILRAEQGNKKEIYFKRKGRSQNN